VIEPRSAYSKDDESELILKGYLAFLDPPKETAPMALAALRKIGVTVKVLTGDNDLVTRNICKEAGLPVDKLVLGSQVEIMTDEELATSAEQVHVFARVSPAHKQRIIRVLQQKRHVVGFLGDGILASRCWPSRAPGASPFRIDNLNRRMGTVNFLLIWQHKDGSIVTFSPNGWA
jgi:P-type Mg2+ transporter